MKTVLAISILLLSLFAARLLTAIITRLGRQRAVGSYRIKYIARTVNLGLAVITAMVLSLVFGIEYSQVSVILSSVFAVIGVALFAQWSILSNITGSLIIFFAFPYRVGDLVKVVDKDDDIYGHIEEISLFHVIINREGDLITYPNSQILQKAVIKVNDRDRFHRLRQQPPTETPATPAG